VIGLLGFLTPPLLGLAGAYLVLAGQAWPVRWVVLVLLFVAYLKTRDMFTMVIVLLLGAGIGWVAVRGDPELQAGVAVAPVWLLLLGAITPRPVPGESKKTSDLTPGHWDSLSCGSWPFSRCGSEAAGCSGSECRSNPITERHSVHIATAAAAPARPPTPPGGSNGIPCARFVRMGMPRRVNRAEETS
jgi:hypothetical protein